MSTSRSDPAHQYEPAQLAASVAEESSVDEEGCASVISDKSPPSEGV